MAVSEPLRLAELAAVGFGVTVCAILAMPARLRRRLSVANHRGAPVPATLGIAVFAGSVGAQAVTGIVAVFVGTELSRATWALMAAATLAFGAGLLDDLRPGGPRGLLGHARELARFRFTTGLVKALAGVVGGVLVVFTVPERSPIVMIAGVLLIAGAANLWNGLDVAPGRAGKLFVIGAVPLMFFSPPALLARMLGAGVAALWPDLRERGMLGDAGSNLLGLVLGAALYTATDGVAVVVAATVAVGLNVVAETVTLSRAIAAVPPLRWLDRAGRLPDPSPAAAPAPPEPAAGADEADPEPAGLH